MLAALFQRFKPRPKFNDKPIPAPPKVTNEPVIKLVVAVCTLIEIPVPEILAMEAPRLIPEPEAPGEATENLIPPTAPVPVDLPDWITNSPAAILDPAASIPRRKEVVAVPEVLRPKIIVLVVMFELPP